MILNRDLDAYSDAVLVAVLRFVVARGEWVETEEGRMPVDDVLTFSGMEKVDDLVRVAQQLALFRANGAESVAMADETYREHRLAIDPLWRYVERYGMAALAQEIRARLGGGE